MQVTIPLMKFIADMVRKNSKGLTFCSSSLNGPILFREASKVIVAYGSNIVSCPPIRIFNLKNAFLRSPTKEVDFLALLD
ncbi:unnamed protein product [Dovyalis caffra]|uniref:Uncharacterized protein n=1 Tax=Dovyalis caffra TaxID=77055 RepID=A0AAV1QRQ0_9ROSI|nr:unnamed protein product [Dovyalis caffra]